MGNSLLYQLDNVEFEFTMRTFFAKIVEFIYNLAGKSVDMLYEYIAKNRFGLDGQVSRITESISMLLLIFMVFRLTIKLLNYLIDPDSVFDKGVGFASLIKKIIIGIVILASINPMFDLLYKIQSDILDSDALNSIILGNEKRGKIITETDEYYYYPIRTSHLCPENYSIIARSKGEALAIQALLPFYNLNDPNDIQNETLKNNLQEEISKGASGYCGYKFEKAEDIGSDVVIADSKEKFEELVKTKKKAGFWSGVNSVVYWFAPPSMKVSHFLATGLITKNAGEKAAEKEEEVYGFTVSDISTLVSPNIYLNSIDSTGNILLRITADFIGPLGLPISKIQDAFRGDDSWFAVDFHYFWATIFGIIFILLIISFCFDTVIRAFSLFFYQVIAPVPIILYMSPIKKDNEMLSNWIKKVLSCWGGLFIRLAALDFIILIITIVRDSTIIDLGKNGFIVQIIVICGGLMFAKKLPKLLEELIPGLKFDGMELNPLKRFRNEALGSSVIEGGINRTLGTATGIAGGLFAGYKAGKEVGDIGRGMMTGALSGASTGFKNKKWSLGSSMNQTYKNLTGNDMKNLTMSSFILSGSKGSKEQVAEVKGYIKKAYDQRNKYLSDLNISEHTTAALANQLMEQGINVNGGSFEKQLQNKEQQLNELKNNTEYISDRGNYNNVKRNYDGLKAIHEQKESEYHEAERKASEIANQINEVQRQRLSGNVNGIHMDNSYFENKLKELQAQKQLADSNVRNLKNSRDASEANLNSAKSRFDDLAKEFSSKYGEINRLENEIRNIRDNETNIKSDLSQYEFRRTKEEELRQTISGIDKDIETLKNEKREREQFYHIDESPQDDYTKVRDNINNRQQKIDEENSNGESSE